MGLRDNFKQAARELIDGRDNTRSQDYNRQPETPPVYYHETTETAQETTSSRYMDSIPDQPPEMSTVIAPGTVIRGTIESQCNVEVYGEVQGDITTAKDLKLQGSVQGNATGGNIAVSGLQLVATFPPPALPPSTPTRRSKGMWKRNPCGSTGGYGATSM